MTEEPSRPNLLPSAARRLRPHHLTTLRFRPFGGVSGELFARLAAANPELRLERTAGGDLEVMSPAGGGASNKNSELTYQLGHWAKNAGRDLGLCFDSSGGFVLPNGAIRSPDASWVSRDRWEALSAEDRETFPPLCPDFVAEIRSSTDRKAVLRKKLREYIAQGARLGWLIDPRAGTVEVYQPGRPVEVLDRPASLRGDDVLPGLVVDLAGILSTPG